MKRPETYLERMKFAYWYNWRFSNRWRADESDESLMSVLFMVPPFLILSIGIWVGLLLRVVIAGPYLWIAHKFHWVEVMLRRWVIKPLFSHGRLRSDYHWNRIADFIRRREGGI